MAVSDTVLPVTSDLRDTPLRVGLAAGDDTGLVKPSQVMLDKAMTVAREKVGPAFGHLDPETMLTIERGLAVFLGIAK